MVRTSRGFKTKTRKKFRKDFREKFKVTPYLQDFKKDDKVIIMIDPSSNSAQPHSRFKGHIGIIQAKRGSAFLIKVKIGNRIKEIIASPEHLKPHN